MGDRRRHRSAAPGDGELFGPAAVAALRAATAELSWLFGRGYAERSALKLVGDRHGLRARQRTAVLRAAAGDAELAARAATRRDSAEIGGELVVDTYNLLTTLESALGGAVVIACRDGCLRDLAGLHGTWRRVAETRPALELVGEALAAAGPPPACAWLVDRPVSNSGRLAALIEALAREHGWPWTVELAPDVDERLARAAAPVVTADRAVLDRVGAWCNLGAEIVRARVRAAWLVELGPEGGPPRA